MTLSSPVPYMVLVGLSALFALLPGTLVAASSAAPAPIDVYIFAGQSNSYGSAYDETLFEPSAADKNILFSFSLSTFGARYACVGARNPNGTCEDIGGDNVFGNDIQYDAHGRAALDPSQLVTTGTSSDLSDTTTLQGYVQELAPDLQTFGPTPGGTQGGVKQVRSGAEKTFIRNIYAQQRAQSCVRKLAVIKVSVGASGLTTDWLGHNFLIINELLSRIADVKQELVDLGYTPNFRAFVWIQGENDSQSIDTASSYAEALQRLINRVRNNTAPNLPVLISRVNSNFEWIHKPGGTLVERAPGVPLVQAAEESVAASVGGVWVSQDTLPYNQPDGPHYTQAGYEQMGRDLAIALRQHFPWGCQ